ncbi:hypothetical protein F-VV10_0193 [Faustovirus]|nr:hypothetical protein F-VV10_0193 [Faustovirus]
MNFTRTETYLNSHQDGDKLLVTSNNVPKTANTDLINHQTRHGGYFLSGYFLTVEAFSAPSNVIFKDRKTITMNDQNSNVVAVIIDDGVYNYAYELKGKSQMPCNLSFDSENNYPKFSSDIGTLTITGDSGFFNEMGVNDLLGRATTLSQTRGNKEVRYKPKKLTITLIDIDNAQPFVFNLNMDYSGNLGNGTCRITNTPESYLIKNDFSTFEIIVKDENGVNLTDTFWEARFKRYANRGQFGFGFGFGRY